MDMDTLNTASADQAICDSINRVLREKDARHLGVSVRILFKTHEDYSSINATTKKIVEKLFTKVDEFLDNCTDIINEATAEERRLQSLREGLSMGYSASSQYIAGGRIMEYIEKEKYLSKELASLINLLDVAEYTHDLIWDAIKTAAYAASN